MNKVAIFSEKPSQARLYADAFKIKNKTKNYIELERCDTFPDGAIITWGYGFLVGLYMPNDYKEEWKTWKLDNLPILPDEYKFKITHKEQFAKAKEICDRADVLINGADLDRAGSNIFYSFINKAGIKGKTIKRLWINSLTPQAVKDGFNNLQDNEKDLLMYQEDKTRQIADWLVGINGSQLYTLLLQKKGVDGVYSVGRVQSVLMYLIYKRDKEIQEFVSKPFYELEAELNHENGNYKGKAKYKEDDKASIKELLAKANIDINTTNEGEITSVEKSLKKTKSPKLHSLSTLQSKANKLWQYNPSKVLEIMQSLYEKKILSYPRTDSNFITKSEFKYLCENLEHYKSILSVSFEADTEPKKRYVDNTKVQEHYAIIPTEQTNIDVESLSTEEQNIYFEVLRTTLAMFHNDYEYEETQIVTNVKGIEFHTKGKAEVNKGWKILFPVKNDKKEKTKNDLPIVNKGDNINADLVIKEGKTEPPKPYSEGQLITLMKTAGKHVDDEIDVDILKEVEGIGTEATRAGIIETIKEKEYITINKNIVSISQKGIILSEAIEGTLLASPSMTAKWESYLQKIGKGEGSSEHFLNNIKKFLYATIENATKQIDSMNNSIDNYKKTKGIVDCPSCNDGRIENKGKFYGCTGYKEGCKVTFPKKLAGKSITNTIIKTLCTKRQTNKLKGFTGKKGKFETKLILNDKNEIKFDFSK